MSDIVKPHQIEQKKRQAQARRERNRAARMTTTAKTVPMPPEVRKAIWAVINYVGPDEKENWEEDGCWEEGDDRHIWCSIKRVQDWLVEVA